MSIDNILGTVYNTITRSNKPDQTSNTINQQQQPKQYQIPITKGQVHDMNTLELTQKLLKMAQQKYNAAVHPYIINAIIAHYLTKKDYYEEHAITTFQKFLDHQILEF